MEEIGKEYLSVTVDQFRHMKKRAEKAIAQLDEQELHWRPNEQSNNIAIIIKHLSGNMHSRWVDFFTTDGEKTYRDRENEFVDDIESKQVLMKRWEEGWKLLFQTVEQLSEEDLLKTVTIRTRPISVLQALQIEIVHVSNHLGQILYIGKQIKGEDWKILSIPKKDQ